MQRNEAQSQGVDIFRVPLQGLVVECKSIDDAVAVKNADAILSDRDSGPYMPAHLERLAEVLAKYHRDSAAEMLKDRASRMRAAAYLKDTIGYERES